MQEGCATLPIHACGLSPRRGADPWLDRGGLDGVQPDVAPLRSLRGGGRTARGPVGGAARPLRCRGPAAIATRVGAARSGAPRRPAPARPQAVRDRCPHGLAAERVRALRGLGRTRTGDADEADAVVVGPIDRSLVPHGRRRDAGLSRGVCLRRRALFGRRRLSGRRLERAGTAGVPVWPRGCGRRLSAGGQAVDGGIRRVQGGALNASVKGWHSGARSSGRSANSLLMMPRFFFARPESMKTCVKRAFWEAGSVAVARRVGSDRAESLSRRARTAFSTLW